MAVYGDRGVVTYRPGVRHYLLNAQKQCKESLTDVDIVGIQLRSIQEWVVYLNLSTTATEGDNYYDVSAVLLSFQTTGHVAWVVESQMFYKSSERGFVHLYCHGAVIANHVGFHWN